MSGSGGPQALQQQMQAQYAAMMSGPMDPQLLQQQMQAFGAGAAQLQQMQQQQQPSTPPLPEAAEASSDGAAASSAAGGGSSSDANWPPERVEALQKEMRTLLTMLLKNVTGGILTQVARLSLIHI